MSPLVTLWDWLNIWQSNEFSSYNTDWQSVAVEQCIIHVWSAGTSKENEQQVTWLIWLCMHESCPSGFWNGTTPIVGLRIHQKEWMPWILDICQSLCHVYSQANKQSKVVHPHKLESEDGNLILSPSLTWMNPWSSC